MDPLDPSGPSPHTVSLLDVELDSPGRVAAMFDEASASHAVPVAVGRYTVRRRLGAGGMGEVFEAHDPMLDRLVAIKVVHGELLDPTHAASVRLLREAQTLARVNHPNVVQIFEVGIVARRVYFAMEIVDGVTLRAWARQTREAAARIDVLLQAGRGLHAVHRVGLVHRDVKPDNVIVGAPESGLRTGRVRVVDFGLSRFGGAATDPPHAGGDLPESLASPDIVFPSRLTATGAMVGTPVYMAPEQILRQVVDARCDQFAFCVMAWELLAGQRPFPSGSMLALMESHRHGPSAPPASTDVPPAVWHALQRGLAHAPAERWPDIDSLLDAIERGARRSPRRGRVAAAAVLGASALAIPWMVARADADPCAGLGPDGPATREQIERVAALGDGSVTDRAVDELVAGIVSLAEHRVEHCRAAATLDAAEDRRIDACIEAAATRLATLGDALASDGPTRAVVVAIDALPHADCMRASSSTPELPADPAVADAVTRVRAAIVDATTRLELEHVLDAAERAPTIAADAAATAHAPLLAEAALFEGELAAAMGEPERARDRLEAAAALAESTHHDTLAADANAALLRVAIAGLADPEAARVFLRRAETTAARTGPDPARDRELRLRRGQLAALEGDLVAARAEVAPLVAGLTDASPQAWDVMSIAADIEEHAGDLDAAHALHERARRAMTMRLGEDSPSLAEPDYNLGKIDLRRDRAATSRASLQRALDAWSASAGRDHLELALVHTALQQWETQYGSLAAARDHAARALALRSDALAPDHPDVGLAHLGVGAAAMLLGDLDAAQSSYLAALVIHEQALGVDHPQTALVRLNLGEARVEAGQGAAALADIQAALLVLAQVGGLDDGLMAFAHRVHASALRAAGNDAAALLALDRAESLGADVSDPPEAALRALERVRLARARPAAVAWTPAVDVARSRARHVAGDGGKMLASRLELLASDPPPNASATTLP
jgi:tetratricopeptide (TPR) repeat protein